MARVTFPFQTISDSEDQTKKVGYHLAKMIKGPARIAFQGDLGAGKTTFIKGFCSFFSQQEDIVQSPTFVYLNIYSTCQVIYHFDLYRLDKKQDFLDKGFEDYFSEEGICLIEWPDKIFSILPKPFYLVQIKHFDLNRREILITKQST